jgi:hypothetical protein
LIAHAAVSLRAFNKVLCDVEPGEVFAPNISKASSGSSTHEALLKAIMDHECDDVDDAAIIYA